MEDFPIASDKIACHQVQTNKIDIDKETATDVIRAVTLQAAGTTLIANVTAVAHNDAFTWTISKSATPGSLVLCNGANGTVHYTISVTKSANSTAFINGVVTVTNAGAVATQDLAITVNLTKPPSSTVIASTTVDFSSNPILDPGETGNYEYSMVIPGSITVAATYKVTADITILNHSGHIGTPFGPSPSATAIIPPLVINGTIHVTDDNHIVHQEFTDSGDVSYDFQYKCPDNTGTNTNTAIIDETGQSASASVNVNCEICRRGLIIRGIIKEN